MFMIMTLTYLILLRLVQNGRAVAVGQRQDGRAFGRRPDAFREAELRLHILLLEVCLRVGRTSEWTNVKINRVM